MNLENCFVRPCYYVGTTCTTLWHLAKTYPVVSVCFGVSVAFSTVAMHLSTGSPRWKGAPSLVSHSKKDAEHVCLCDTSHHGVFAEIFTSPVTPSIADEDILPALLTDNVELLHLTSDNASLALPFSGISQQFCSSFSDCLCCSNCQGSFATFYYLCESAALIPNMSQANFPCFVDGTNYMHRSFCRCFAGDDYSSNGGHCGAECTFGASWVYFSGNENSQAKAVAMKFPQCDNNNVIMSNGVLDHLHISQHNRNFLEFQNLVESPALDRGFVEEGNGRIGSVGKLHCSEGEHIPKQNFWRVPSGYLNEGSPSCLSQLDYRHIFNSGRIFCGLARLFTYVFINRALWFDIFYGRLKATRNFFLKKGCVHSLLSSDNGLCTALSAAEQYEEESGFGRKGKNTLKRLPGFEEKLRSLEARLEQQLRLSVERYDEGIVEKFSGGVGNVEGSQKFATNISYASFTKSSNTGSSDTLRLSRYQQTASSIKAADRANFLGTQQHDRGIDDVFVRHRSDRVAPYSLSLTYHDAYGGSRTVDTQKLPPLKLPPRSSAASADGDVVSGASALRGQSLRLSYLREATSRGTNHFCAASVDDVQRVVKGCFVAPLPLFGHATGSRLQGVAGKGDKFRIGAFLGGGGCGKVYECLNTETGEVFAVKQVMFDPKDAKLRSRLRQLKLEKEVLALAARHRMPWIVGFYGTEKHGHSALMFLEYCAGGSLLDYMLSGGNSVTYQSQGPADVISAAGVTGIGQRPLLASLAGGGGSYHQRTEKEEKFAGSCGLGDNADAKESPPLGVFDSLPFVAAADLANEKKKLCEMPFFSISEVQRFARQVLEALYFLHVHGYAHMDVKTANILVTEDGDTRLADFGCSMRLRQNVSCCRFCDPAGQNAADITNDTALPTAATTATSAAGSSGTAAAAQSNGKHDKPTLPYPVLDDVDSITEFRGTALYIAPEMLRFERERIGTPGDVWSFGCVVMELATGEAPWRHIAADKLRVLYSVASAREELPLPPRVLQAAEDAARWLSTHAADECVDRDVNTEVAQKQRCMESGGCKNGAAVYTSGEKCDCERRQQMHLWLALKDVLSLCLRIRPEERPSCEDLLHHPFLNFD